jgi:hypothetical protein
VTLNKTEAFVTCSLRAQALEQSFPAGVQERMDTSSRGPELLSLRCSRDSAKSLRPVASGHSAQLIQLPAVAHRNIVLCHLCHGVPDPGRSWLLVCLILSRSTVCLLCAHLAPGCTSVSLCDVCGKVVRDLESGSLGQFLGPHLTK